MGGAHIAEGGLLKRQFLAVNYCIPSLRSRRILQGDHNAIPPSWTLILLESWGE